MSDKRNEWLRLMNELAALNRAEYRRVRAAAWRAVRDQHSDKTDEQITEWQGNAS